MVHRLTQPPWPRRLAVLLTLLMAAFGVAYLMAAIPYWTSARIFGVDFDIYVGAAQRWLNGSGFYLPYQVSGPYDPQVHVGADSPVLYPPTMLALLVPFTVLPAPLWWAIPLAVTALVVAAWRPRPAVWPVLAFLVVFPMTQWEIATGNPVLWFTMALALATRYRWPAAFIVLKPTLLPFALFGANRRRWWLGLAGVAVLSLLFMPMWPDYLRASANMQADTGLLYSLNQYPMLMIPLIAWLGRRPNDDAAAGAHVPGT